MSRASWGSGPHARHQELSMVPKMARQRQGCMPDVGSTTDLTVMSCRESGHKS